MPQFDFFATWDDNWTLLASLLESAKVNIIPDKWFRTRDIEIYRKCDNKLKQHITRKRRVFLFSQGTEISPKLGLVRQEGGQKSGYFSIEPDLIGEVLELTFPACFEENHTVCLGSGSLTHPKEYFDHASNKWRPPSKRLARFFSEIRSLLKQNLHVITVGKSKPWLGAQAKKLLEQGDATITDLGIV